MNMTVLQIINKETVNAVSSITDATGLDTGMSNSINNNMSSLIILLIINVSVIVINFILDRLKHRKDNHNHKVHLIAVKGVKIESEIYSKFQKLSTLQQGDEHALLDGVLDLQAFLNNNQLYIEKKYLTIATEFLDYFKSIIPLIKIKDIQKEEDFFHKLSEAFYGE